MAITERYASQAGAGAHDGTSEANAWSIAEAAANHSGGQRLNVKGDVTWASTLTWANSGDWSSGGFILRPYVSTPGDVSFSRLNDGTGPIDTSGWPTWTYTGATGAAIITGNDLQIQFAKIIGSSTTNGSTLIDSNLTQDDNCIGCYLERNGSSGNVIGAGTQSALGCPGLYDCDVVQAGTSTSPVVDLARANMDGGRVVGNGLGVGVVADYKGLTGVQVINCTYGWNTGSGSDFLIADCSFSDCSVAAINLQDKTARVRIRNVACWDSNGTGKLLGYSLGGPVSLIDIAYGVTGSQGRTTVTDPESDLGHIVLNAVELTSSPFESTTDLRPGAALIGARLDGGDIGAIPSAGGGGGSTIFIPVDY